MVYIAFNESELRFRHQAAEAFIEDSQEVLHTPAVVRALGEHAYTLQAYADSLFVPNIRGGEVQFPEEAHESSRIPLIMVGRGEEYRLHPDYFNILPTEKKRIAEYLEKAYNGLSAKAIDSHITMLQNFVSEYADINRTVRLHDTANASVQWNSDTPEYTQNGITFHLPYVTRPILMVDPVSALSPSAGVLSVHELTHAHQAFTEPLSAPLRSPKNQALRGAHHEIQGYRRHAQAIEALSPDIAPRTQAIMYNTLAPHLPYVVEHTDIKTEQDLIKALKRRHAKLAKKA